MPVCTLLHGDGGLDSAPKARFCAVPPQKFDSLRSLRMTDSSGPSSRGGSRADPGEQKRADLLFSVVYSGELVGTKISAENLISLPFCVINGYR